MTTRHTIIETPLGALTVVRRDDGIAGIYFPGHWTRPDRTGFGPRRDDDPGFVDIRAQLDEYFAGDRREFDLALAPAGTPLAQRLRRLLLAIPPGATTTYGALAALKASAAVDFYVDSQYVRGGVTGWIAGWKRNGWKTADRKPVKNIDLWQQLDTLVAGHDIRWHWVKGHAGTEGNERADRLANEGMAPFKPKRR